MKTPQTISPVQLSKLIGQLTQLQPQPVTFKAGTDTDTNGAGSLSASVPIQQKLAEATLTVKHLDGSETTAVEAVGKPTAFSGPTCEVGVDASFTANMGNYQSARVGVSIKIPAAHAEIDQVYEFARAWVDAKMQQQIASINAAKS